MDALLQEPWQHLSTGQGSSEWLTIFDSLSETTIPAPCFKETCTEASLESCLHAMLDGSDQSITGLEAFRASPHSWLQELPRLDPPTWEPTPPHCAQGAVNSLASSHLTPISKHGGLITGPGQMLGGPQHCHGSPCSPAFPGLLTPALSLGSASDSQQASFASFCTPVIAWSKTSRELEALVAQMEQQHTPVHHTCLAGLRTGSDASTQSLGLHLDLPMIQCRPPAGPSVLPDMPHSATGSSFLGVQRPVLTTPPGMPLNHPAGQALYSFHSKPCTPVVSTPASSPGDTPAAAGPVHNPTCTTPVRQELPGPMCNQPSPSQLSDDTDTETSAVPANEIVNSLLGLIKPGYKRRNRQDIAAVAAIRRAALGRGTTHYRSGCFNCGARKTPQWRAGPDGPRTLCNACGVRFKKGLPLAYVQSRALVSNAEQGQLHNPAATAVKTEVVPAQARGVRGTNIC